MAIKVTCSCGTTAMVKDEHAGRTGQSRVCKAPVIVGQPSPSPTGTIIPVPPPVHDFSQSTIERMAPAPLPETGSTAAWRSPWV